MKYVGNDLIEEDKQMVNQSSHSLIYSISEYRRPVTDLAIECVRKQSLGNVGCCSNKKPSSLHLNNNYNTYHNNYHNHQQQLRSKPPQYNSIPTKKKRFNYGVTP